MPVGLWFFVHSSSFEVLSLTNVAEGFNKTDVVTAGGSSGTGRSTAVMLTDRYDHAPDAMLLDTGSGQKYQADRPHREELQCVPEAEEDEEVEPSGAAVCDEGREGTRCQEVGHREQHRGHAPLESSSRSDGVEENVGGHVPAQERAGVDAEGPELADHDGSPLLRGLATKNLEGLPVLGDHAVTLGVTATHI